jgi:hypothetical protein
MIVKDGTETNEFFDKIENLARDHSREFHVQINGGRITLRKTVPSRQLVVTIGDGSGYKVDNPWGFQSFVDSGPKWSTHGRSVSESEALEKVEGWLNE